MQWTIFARLNAAPVFCQIKRNHFLSARRVYFGKTQRYDVSRIGGVGAGVPRTDTEKTEIAPDMTGLK